MPTSVVQHDKTSRYSPFLSKYPYRHHGTRIISVPQATPVNPKTLNLIKSPSPVLPPADSTENALKSNKSCVEEEELPERLGTPVAVQLLIPASTDPSPLRDICQSSFDSDHSISKDVVREVLNYLTKPIPHENCMEFHGVRAQEFGLIEKLLGDTARVILNLIRLTYDYHTRILTINMPSVLHEATFDDMKQFVSQTISTLPFDRTVIDPLIRMTWPLEVKDGIVTPDIIITVNAMEGPTEVLLIPFYGECVLSETDEHVFEKMAKVIRAHPDIICVVVVLVHEATDYTSPKILSDVSNILHGDTNDGYPQPHTLRSFIRKRSTSRTVGQPIMIAGHTWCHLSSVEYFVWTKEGEAPIDIRSQDPAHMAYGTLLPEVDMDAITEMLEQGLNKIKDSFVDFQKEIEPDLDCTALVESHITTYSDWHVSAKRIINASEIAAHRRYLTWHRSLFGTESDESSYTPSQEPDGEGGKETAESSERKCASTSELPCSRFKILKAT
ncbi:hypothetical protein EDD22DRAFT_961359 [Suillus occidentalis]|nr:hypothetical protein EDD22DRAFT_961359 [Suillus occidentalis]